MKRNEMKAFAHQNTPTLVMRFQLIMIKFKSI